MDSDCCKLEAGKWYVGYTNYQTFLAFQFSYFAPGGNIRSSNAMWIWKSDPSEVRKFSGEEGGFGYQKQFITLKEISAEDAESELKTLYALSLL